MDKIYHVLNDDAAPHRFGTAVAGLWRRAVQAPRSRCPQGGRADPRAEEPTPLSIRGRATTVLSYEDSF